MKNEKVYHVTYDAEDGTEHQSTNEKIKFIFRQITQHIVFRVIIILLILADIGLLIGTLNDANNTVLDSIAFGFSCVFFFEVLLRVYGLGYKTYLRNWVNVADCIIVMASFIINMITIILDSNNTRYGSIITAFRLLRVPRILSLIVRNHKKFIKSSRYVTSENKRRFQSDGFDLDLCYITDRVIAMSFPSSGFAALYRNSISEVAKFLNTKYGPHYKIYNLCEERGYDTNIFNNQVERFMIKDHNTPRLEEMIKFAQSSGEWLMKSNKNVIVVHCKGGKGRTGTMICVHLIDSEVFDNAELCLQYFGQRRTDLLYGKKFQGVETPSQSRYVGYFEQIKRSLDFCVPERKNLKIERIVIHGAQELYGTGEFNILMEIIQGTTEVEREKKLLCVDFNDQTSCKVKTEKNGCSTTVELSLTSCPIIYDDIKIKFFSTNKRVKNQYDHCAFFFWFHTSFIGNNQLSLTREQLDNPHKKKTWKIYDSDFAVNVFFVPS